MPVSQVPDYDGAVEIPTSEAPPQTLSDGELVTVAGDDAPFVSVAPAGFGRSVKFQDGQEGVIVGEAGPDGMLLVKIGDTVVGQHRENIVETPDLPPAA